jgi:hypothetical protein
VFVLALALVAVALTADPAWADGCHLDPNGGCRPGGGALWDWFASAFSDFGPFLDPNG